MAFRRKYEIVAAEKVFFDKIWYMRHLYLKYKIESGQETCDAEIWKGALANAERIRQQYGEENLLPKDDFEWGMLHGKLSALRWALGEEWDFLDT